VGREHWAEINVSGLGLLFLGTALVLLTARGLLALLNFRLRHPATGLAAYWIAGSAVIAGSVFLAGKIGLLSLPGIVLLQALFLLGLLLAGKLHPTRLLRLLACDLTSSGKMLLGLFRVLPRNSIQWLSRLLAILLLLILAELFVVAALTPTLNHDTHRYRLPRIGMWLQENHIGQFGTPVDHMNFLGRTSDLLMLWLVSFFPVGFPLIQLVQWSAGVVTLASTYELARRLRLPRLLRLGSVFVLLGMPNVLVQFTTSQTDLTAAAFSTAGLLFVWEALKSRHTSSFLLAGLAFGLAVGAKQTVLVWGPGFAAIGFLWWWSSGRSIKTILWPAVMALLLALSFCLPLFVETYCRYGDWLVPERYMRKFPSLEENERVQPLFFPFVWLWHLTWPVVQPPLLWSPMKWLHQQSLLVIEETTVKGEGDGLPRMAGLLKTWFANHRFYEDFSPPSFMVLGVVAAAFILLAWKLLRHRTWQFSPVMALTAGCAFFWLSSLKFGWEIYAWRFWVTPSPFFVLAAVSLPVWLWPERKSHWPLWIGFWLLLNLPVTFRGLWLHGNNGLLTLLHPDQAADALHNLAMHQTAKILDRIPRRLVVSADSDLRSSFLFRRPIAHHVTYRDLLPTDDYVTPVRKVLTESEADTAIISGPPQHLAGLQTKLLPLSLRRPLWAVRFLEEGELPPGSLVWWEGHYADGWIAPESVLVLQQWPSLLLRLRLRNYHPEPLTLTAAGGAGRQNFSLPSNTWQDVTLLVRTHDVLRFQTDRAFIPQPPDTRQLGVLIEIPPGQEGEPF